MDFEITKLSDYTLVKVLNDSLDINNAQDLKSELVVINAEGEKNLVLDLSQCAYSDSVGLSAIQVANLLCENALGTFILTSLQPDVEHMIRIAMLHTVLVITRTLEEAELILNEKRKNTI